MFIIDTVINTILGRLTLDPAGMHCPWWDDAFVSSSCCCLSPKRSAILIYNEKTNRFALVQNLKPTNSAINYKKCIVQRIRHIHTIPSAVKKTIP